MCTLRQQCGRPEGPKALSRSPFAANRLLPAPAPAPWRSLKCLWQRRSVVAVTKCRAALYLASLPRPVLQCYPRTPRQPMAVGAVPAGAARNVCAQVCLRSRVALLSCRAGCLRGLRCTAAFPFVLPSLRIHASFKSKSV